MINPLKLLKLAKNVGSPAELLDIFGEMGIRIQVQQISDLGREAAFCELAEMAMAPGHQVVMMRAGEPGGPRVKAILVLETDDSTPLFEGKPDQVSDEKFTGQLLPCPAQPN